jgi:cytochrome P450
MDELGCALLEHLTAETGEPGSLLHAAMTDGDLDPGEVVSNAAVIMFGGIETTEGALLNAVWYLLREPDLFAAVVADPRLAADAVEESLRIEPAAAVVDRYATRDVELAGTAIADGSHVTVSLAGANRDPAVFADPDRFELDRPQRRQHLAFAAGPHVCVGMDLARLEVVTAVTELAARFPGLRLAAGAPPPTGLVFRKPASLPVLLR